AFMACSHYFVVFCIEQKTAYEFETWLEFRRVLFRSLYSERDLKNPAIIVDANHSNSNKQDMEQIRIVKEVLHSRKLNETLKKMVKGVMIESYLVAGNQKIGQGEHIYGKSITDPCLGWEDSEKLLYTIYELV